MSFYDAIRVGASGASTGYEVERSLRFNKSERLLFSKAEIEIVLYPAFL